MPHPILFVSQTDNLIQIVDINLHTDWQTVQIKTSWLRSQLIWIYTVCKEMAYLGSAGLGLKGVYGYKWVLFMGDCFISLLKRGLLKSLGSKFFSSWIDFNPSSAEPEYPAFAKSVDPDQLASEESNWSGSALFVSKIVKYQKPWSSNRIGWKLSVGMAS